MAAGWGRPLYCVCQERVCQPARIIRRALARQAAEGAEARNASNAQAKGLASARGLWIRRRSSLERGRPRAGPPKGQVVAGPAPSISQVKRTERASFQAWHPPWPDLFAFGDRLDHQPASRPAPHAFARVAPRTRRPDGGLCRVRDAGAISRRADRRASMVPRPRRAVRCLAHGPVVSGRRRQRRGAGKPGADGSSIGLAVGKQRYALFTNSSGGILDDLMVCRPEAGSGFGDLFLIVNAACKDADTAAPDHPHRPPLPGSAARRSRAAGAAGAAGGRCAGATEPAVAELTFMTGGVFKLADSRLFCYPLGLYRRGWLRDFGRRRACQGSRPSIAGTARSASRPGSARATRCAWKPACACMATISTHRPHRSRPA